LEGVRAVHIDSFFKTTFFRVASRPRPSIPMASVEGLKPTAHRIVTKITPTPECSIEDTGASDVKVMSTPVVASVASSQITPPPVDPVDDASATLVTPPFIAKLSSMLENPQFEEFIRWNDEGDTVVVKNLREFANVVIPKYFKHNNFASCKLT
jgi:hypothetical protein